MNKNDPDAAETKALALRSQALACLQEAQAIDGLKPYCIIHRHEYGTSAYLGWFKKDPASKEAASILDTEFEPKRGEELSIEESFTLEELTGLSPAMRGL